MVVYLDFYFIIHFCINFFCVLFTLEFRQKQEKKLRIAFISFINAIASCMIVVYQIDIPQIVIVVIQILSLLFFSTSWEGITNFCSNLVTFIAVLCVTAGGLTFLLRLRILIFGKKKIDTMYMLIISGVFLVVLFLYGTKILYRKIALNRKTANVLLVQGKKQCQVRALLDSGNMLVSPYTGERIAVISRKTAKSLELEKEQNPLLVPFSTIGGGGMMEVYRLEKMILEEQREKQEILVAVNESLDSHREIQMILNI